MIYNDNHRAIEEMYHKMLEWTCQITYNGKFYYTGIGSLNEGKARKAGLEMKDVKLTGCDYSSIHRLAHQGSAITINGQPIDKSKIATEQEKIKFFDSLGVLCLK